jgi:hypothetical protein
VAPCGAEVAWTSLYIYINILIYFSMLSHGASGLSDDRGSSPASGERTCITSMGRPGCTTVSCKSAILYKPMKWMGSQMVIDQENTRGVKDEGK